MLPSVQIQKKPESSSGLQALIGINKCFKALITSFL